MPRLLTRRFTLAWLANLSQEMAWALFIHFPGFLLGFGASEIEIGLLVGLTALASVVVRVSFIMFNVHVSWCIW